ncbi:MAG TPA: YceI family protein [Chitinophagaceae bacterium]|nr:YceI family protein [Chitinophagaceae bacterium]
MKKYLIGVLLSGLSLAAAGQNKDVWITRNAQLGFFSSGPIENISATSNQAVSAMNIKTGEVFFKVLISTFQFRNSLMQEHFNEDYLQSDKYPYAQFKGTIVDIPDLSKDGTFPVTIQGQLTIHNVTRAYTVKGNLEVKGGKITASTKFDVRLSDHDITIPRLVIENIAEVVQVTVMAIYSPVQTAGS